MALEVFSKLNDYMIPILRAGIPSTRLRKKWWKQKAVSFQRENHSASCYTYFISCKMRGSYRSLVVSTVLFSWTTILIMQVILMLDSAQWKWSVFGLYFKGTNHLLANLHDLQLGNTQTPVSVDVLCQLSQVQLSTGKSHTQTPLSPHTNGAKKKSICFYHSSVSKMTLIKATPIWQINSKVPATTLSQHSPGQMKCETSELLLT